MECQNRCQHLSITATLTMLRKCGYLVTRARQAVKNVLSDCCVCRKYNSFSFRYPKLTNLPKHRVNFVRPYKHTGIDYTGHVWVDTDNGAKKYYILVFTYLNIRSIHMELVESMSSAAFVQAFIRFTNIYGIPSHIYTVTMHIVLNRYFPPIYLISMWNLRNLRINFWQAVSNTCVYQCTLHGLEAHESV